MCRFMQTSCDKVTGAMLVPLTSGAGGNRLWRHPLLWIMAAILSVLLYTSHLSPASFTSSSTAGTGIRTLQEAQPNAMEIVSAEAVQAQSQAQPKVPPTTIIPQKVAGKVYTWSVDDNKLVLGRSSIGGEPGAVANIKENVTAVAAGGHSLAVTVSGVLWTWGRNDSKGGGGGGSQGIANSGQLGAPRIGAELGLPGQIAGTGNRTNEFTFVAVAAGRYHSVGLDRYGRVYTWGLNDYGQLGRPGVLASDTNVGCVSGAECRCPDVSPALISRISQAPHFVKIAAGRYHTLAVTAHGQVWTWGFNLCGRQLVPGLLKGGLNASLFYIPTLVTAGLENVHITTVDAGYVHWAALSKRGDVITCTAGDDGYGGQLPETQAHGGLRPPNAQGELGTTLSSSGLNPSVVPALKASAIATGRCSTLVVSSGGTVLSWGCGQLGRKGPPDTPLQVPGFGANETAGRAVFVAASEYTHLVITETGQVWVWGAVGERNGGTREEPVLLKGLPSNMVAAAASGAHQHFLLLLAEAGWPEVGKPGHVGPFIWDAAPDIFEQLTPFEPSLRNPCFHNRTTGALRCLPYFSIIGVSKCGTTDLYKKLLVHRSIIDSKNKGPHFWDEQHPFDWYLDIYSPVASAVVKDSNLVVGDASTNTFTYSGVGIRGKKNDDVILPGVIRGVQPDMKVIVMLRDPVDRMYSAYWYYGCLYSLYEAWGMSDVGFDAWARESVAEMNACLKGQGASARSCALLHYEGKPQQLIKGMYSVFLPDWQAAYREDQILVINTDTYRQQEEATLQTVLKFLELEEATPAEIARMTEVEANRGHNQNAKVKGCAAKRPNMLHTTRELLADFYAPFDEELAQQMQWHSLQWNRKAKQVH
ncbi:hypothetical protein WJX73_005645 [Symbiochloris irregularis]|uniref:Sulfotransferase domain-containing protein n=1 Tax=Symbiochloris irregularis TaxID=706552 RepID=A0AAW1PR23_9CHLO